MQTAPSLHPLHQDCLGKLHRTLDLAMKTAETASAEGNHKLVLQAVREVTRIVTLMTKMAKTSNQEGKSKTQPASRPTQPQAPSHPKARPEKLSAVQDLDLFQKIYPDLFQPQPSEKPNRALSEMGKKRETTGTKPAVY